MIKGLEINQMCFQASFNIHINLPLFTVNCSIIINFFHVQCYTVINSKELTMDYLGQFAIIHLILHVICICIAY